MAIDVPKNESLGMQLNRMNGTLPEKNLYADPNEKKMDKEQFLKMFMEQLKYQDPMNPVKNEQFSQQMAMFSQLEQQINMNKNIEKLVSSQNNMQVAALQLVGKNIAADRATIYHDKDKPSAIQFKVPQDLNELKVEIKDVNGETVKVMNMGTRNQGDVQTKWDGLDETGRPLPAGRYTYAIAGKDMGGKDVKIETKVEGKVKGVTSASGVVFLLVGDQRIGLNDVETIKDPAEAAKDAAKNVTKPATGADGSTAGIAGAPANGENNASAAAATSAADGNSSGTNSAPSMKVAVAGDAASELGQSAGSESVESGDSGLHPLLPLIYR